MSGGRAYGEKTRLERRSRYVTTRRTFARIKPSTKTRVDVGLRLAGQEPDGRLKPCKMQDTMKVQIGLTSLAELDAEAINWLRLAYNENS